MTQFKPSRTGTIREYREGDHKLIYIKWHGKDNRSFYDLEVYRDLPDLEVEYLWGLYNLIAEYDEETLFKIIKDKPWETKRNLDGERDPESE